MDKTDLNNDKNINRREFLKRIASVAVFTMPTIQSISLLQVDRGWWWWTGHHHHHTGTGQGEPTPPLPPPPPPGYGTP